MLLEKSYLIDFCFLTVQNEPNKKEKYPRYKTNDLSILKLAKQINGTIKVESQWLHLPFLHIKHFFKCVFTILMIFHKNQSKENKIYALEIHE